MERTINNGYSPALDTAQTDLEFKDAILEMCNDLLSSFDLRQILRHLVRHAVTILKAEIACITLAENGKPSSNVHFSNLEESSLNQILQLCETDFENEFGLVFAAFQSGQVIALDDFVRTNEFSPNPALDAYVRQNKIAAALAVPIKVQSQVVAVLSVFKQEPYQWNELDKERAYQLAKLVALPIYNASLYYSTKNLNEELAQRTHEFEVLQDFNRRMRQASNDLSAVAERALSLINEVIQADLGFICLTETNKIQQGQLLAALPDKTAATRYLAQIEADSDLVQQAFSTQKSILVNDILELIAHDPTVSIESNSQWRSALFLRLIRGNRGIGMIGLASTKPNHFSEDQLHFAELMVGQVAYIIQKVTDAQFQKEQEHLQSVLAMAEAASHQLSQPLTELQIELDLIRQYGTLSDLQALERMQDAISRITSHVRQYQKIVFSKSTFVDSEIVILD